MQDRNHVRYLAAIALAAAAAYANAYSAPFVFDDPFAIAGNPTLRHLWPPWLPLLPPHGQGLTVEGRPVLNLSFAADYAVSGLRVWSYHLTNVLIHIFAGWTLFGIVHRTLRRTSAETLAKADAPAAATSASIAFATALIWTLHPLQTESVTYISQRAESLMGLLYLLTLYFFILYAASAAKKVERTVPRTLATPSELKSESVRGTVRSTSFVRFAQSSGVFAVLSTMACLLGMATKEVMATAPLVVLLYDRTFMSGSFAAAWRARRRYYLSLAATWLLLAALAVGTGNRGHTAGFGLGVTEGQYLLGQCEALATYLRLSFWPHPLIFDYGPQGPVAAAPALACGALLLALLAAGLIALTKSGPAARGFGFAVISFFLILTPTSVIPLIRQTIAEHRMYLPLAAVIAVAVCSLWRLAEAMPARLGAVARIALVAAIAIPCLGATIRRNHDYRSVIALYQDTAAKRPDNVLARYNLGLELENEGQDGPAAAEFEAALRLLPAFPQAEFNLGKILAAHGQWSAAQAHYEAALRIEPNYALAHEAFGDALLHLGRPRDARWHYNAAWLIDPRLESARSKRDAIDRAQSPN